MKTNNIQKKKVDVIVAFASFLGYKKNNVNGVDLIDAFDLFMNSPNVESKLCGKDLSNYKKLRKKFTNR